MNRLVPVLIGLLVALGVASTTLFVVDQRQYAVVFALGEIKEVIAKPGLHFKLPPPFQNVQYFDNRILTIDTADV
ncbi:MAG: SPFH domain-containing protein, partial [Burkholderiales bacterium]